MSCAVASSSEESSTVNTVAIAFWTVIASASAETERGDASSPPSPSPSPESSSRMLAEGCATPKMEGSSRSQSSCETCGGLCGIIFRGVFFLGGG